jgi:ABC-type enterochelin transport system substrate-binding protein
MADGTMPQGNKPKSFKVLIILAVLVIIVIVLILAARYKVQPVQAPVNQKPAPAQTQVPSQPNAPSAKVPALKVQEGTLAQLLPNLPVEKNPQVLQNQDFLNVDTGKSELTYIYVTKNTIDQNGAAYKKYFSDNGWKTTGTVNQPQFQALNATKGSVTLNLIFDYKSAAPQDQVDIDYVY